MPPKIRNAKNAKIAKNAKNAKKAKNANFLQSATQSATTKAYSTTMGRTKKGGRRWSPPGGFNTISRAGGRQKHGTLDLGRRVEQRWPSAAHRRWCRACWIMIYRFQWSSSDYFLYPRNAS